MNDNNFKKIFQEINKYQSINLLIVKDEINYILTNKIIDDNKIQHTFDKLLDLAYWYGNEINELYNKLSNYYKKLNPKANNDYIQYYSKILKEKNISNKDK